MRTRDDNEKVERLLILFTMLFLFILPGALIAEELPTDEVFSGTHSLAIGLGMGSFERADDGTDDLTKFDSDSFIGLLHYTYFCNPLEDSPSLPYGLREYVQHPSSASFTLNYTQSSIDIGIEGGSFGELEGDGDYTLLKPELRVTCFFPTLPQFGIHFHYMYQNTEGDVAIEDLYLDYDLTFQLESSETRNDYGGGIVAYITDETRFSMLYHHIDIDSEMTNRVEIENFYDDSETTKKDIEGDEFSVALQHLLQSTALIGLSYTISDRDDQKEQTGRFSSDYYWSRKFSTEIAVSFGKIEYESDGLMEDEETGEDDDYTEFVLTGRYFQNSASSFIAQLYYKTGDPEEGYQALIAFQGYF